jgi:tRNA A-37 threonylcarbamoyl transferase component Bud32
MGDYCQCATIDDAVACSGHGECFLDSKSKDNSGCKCTAGWGDYDNCSTPSCFDNCTTSGGYCDEPYACRYEGILPRDAELIAGVVGGVLVGMIAVVVMVAWLRGSRDHRGERGVGSTVFSDVVSNGSRGRLIDHNGAGMHADADDFYGTYGSMDGSGGGRDSGGGGAQRNANGSFRSTDRDFAKTPRISTVKEKWVILKSDLQVGQMFAAGTSSHVFKGFYRGDKVAIKKIPLGLLLKSEVRKAEFQREAQILSQVIHPHVVHFHGIAETNLHVLIVTEYCPHSLGSLMQQNPWPQDLPKWSDLVITIARQLAEGMAFLHTQEIMHRDLKPENVLLDANFLPKICDFGVARLMKEGGHQFTMTGQIGTPIYMAPEIIVGNRNRYGRGADVYSFGILLWAMWHRDIPYKNLILTENLDAFQLAQRVSRGLRPAYAAQAAAGSPTSTPTRADGPMPQKYADLMEACWQHDPAERPSFSEVANRL